MGGMCNYLLNSYSFGYHQHTVVQTVRLILISIIIAICLKIEQLVVKKEN